MNKSFFQHAFTSAVKSPSWTQFSKYRYILITKQGVKIVVPQYPLPPHPHSAQYTNSEISQKLIQMGITEKTTNCIYSQIIIIFSRTVKIDLNIPKDGERKSDLCFHVPMLESVAKRYC